MIGIQKIRTHQEVRCQNGKIMRKKAQNSNILDFLIRNLYDVDLTTYKTKDHVDPKNAKSLYSVWKDTDNQVSNKIYKRPKTLSSTEIESMTNQGLIRCVGDKVEITAKGSDIIKTMILGNDKSFFDRNNDIDYVTAKNNVNARQASKKQTSKYEQSWWNSFCEEKK